MLWAQAELVDKLKDNWILLAIGLGGLVALFVLLKIAMGGKKKHVDLEKGQREDLAEYPPAPPAGAKRLSANGVPVRLRLVVVAPTGKAADPISLDDVPELFDELIRGLGGFIKTDKPRVKIWPTPLSVAGFATTFHRLVESPDAGMKLSRWIKLAGPARTGQRPIVLGLALYADEPCKLGDVQVETKQWNELLQISR
jgi:hypothetical protein